MKNVNKNLKFHMDMERYENKPSLYVKILLLLYRKYFVCNSLMLKLTIKSIFRLLSQSRGLEIGLENEIGGGLYLGHVYNITINPAVKIGSNCNLHKGLVIGQENRGSRKGVPTIGNSVWIGINAAIVGNITVGDDVLIAPNSYVNRDIPSHSIVFGNPCVIKPCENATECYVHNKVTIE